MFKYLVRIAMRNPVIRRVWSAYRCQQLYRDYRRRREYYSAVAKERGIVFRESEVIAEVRSRLRARGYVPTVRPEGHVHTFAVIPQFSWHAHLLPDLRSLGTVSLFDYVSLGYLPEEFYSTRWNRKRMARRRDMVDRMLSAFREVHKKQPVDWVLCYGGGHSISASVIQQITKETGVPTVNMSFDDKQGWSGPNVGEHCHGSRDITPVFDVFFTSAQVTCEWHAVVGGRGIYMSEGFDNSYHHPRPVDQDIPVSFVGAAYGYRPAVIKYLRDSGIPISVFGAGWPDSHYTDDPVDIFARSQINLGLGGIGYSESLTNVKARDFEVPGTGGGVYLTSFNPDLARHFVVGREISCYRNREEMVELIRFYLSHPEEAREISRRGRDRCLQEHRWLHRYRRILEILGVFLEDGPDHTIVNEMGEAKQVRSQIDQM